MTPCPAETAQWEFLNGEMDREAAAAFTLHLESCSVCRSEMAALRATVLEIRSLPQTDAPDRLAEAAKAALSRKAVPAGALRTGFSRWFNLASGGVLLVSALIISFAFPLHIPAESITAFFRIPADSLVSESARELIGKVVVFLPFLLIPSIMENVRFLIRRKHKTPPNRLRLFSI